MFVLNKFVFLKNYILFYFQEEKSENLVKAPHGLDIKNDAKTTDNIQTTCCSYSYKKWF